MTAFNSFSTTEIDTTDEFASIPLDWYPVMITDAEDAANPKGGRYLILTATIFGNSPFAGRTLKSWVNYEHSNAQCVEIAQKTIAKICEGIQLGRNMTDTDDILNKALEAKIGPQKDSTYDEIKDWRQAAQLGFTDMEDPSFSATANATVNNNAAAAWPGAKT